MANIGGFAAQYGMNPLLQRASTGVQNTGQPSVEDQLAQAGINLPPEVLQSLQANGAPRDAQGVIDPAQARNPGAAEKAALLEQFGPQFQATVDSMRKKIELSGTIGNATNNWTKQAELLVSAFIEGQGFIDQILGLFPDESTMPPEIKSMLDEIMRLQDSAIELLNSALGTSFTKDEFRELVGAKKPGDSGAEGAGGTNEAQGAEQAGAEGSGEAGGGGAGNDAEEKLKETVRALMSEARSLMTAARANPEMAAELAGMALQKAKEGLLIIETIESLQNALGGSGGQPGEGLFGNPASGMEALGALNIGGANAGGANLGSGGLDGGGLGAGNGSAQPAGVGATGLDAGIESEASGLQQEAASLDAERDELQQLADEAMALLGEQGGDASVEYPQSESAAVQTATPFVQSVGTDLFSGAGAGNLFSGAGATFGMQPLFA